MAKGLGKGLGALMGDFAVDVPGEKSPYQLLPIHKVEPNPGQPRQDFDPEELQVIDLSLTISPQLDTGLCSHLISQTFLNTSSAPSPVALR